MIFAYLRYMENRSSIFRFNVLLDIKGWCLLGVFSNTSFLNIWIMVHAVLACKYVRKEV